MSIGLSFPFALSTGSLGYLEATNDVVSAIKSNVHSLLTTNWGERVMHFDFGCNLVEFLFEQKNKQMKARIAERVRSQLSKWMPFVSLAGLYIIFSDEDSSIKEEGFKIQLELVYGNIPINLFLLFPL